MTPILATIAAKLAGQGLSALAGKVVGKQGAAVVREIAEAVAPADPTPDTLLQALESADPEALAELRRIDAEMAAEAYEHVENMTALEVEDRKDAREAARSSSVFLVLVAIFAGLFFILFAATMWLLATQDIPEANAQLFGDMTLTLRDVLLMIVSFVFGSSAGSKIKTFIDSRKSR